MRPARLIDWTERVHIVTRVGIVVGCLMVLGSGLNSVRMSSSPAPPPSATVAVDLPERLTQRKGEWSPVCAKTKQPLIDFSPIDRGQSRNRVLLTVHNCSARTLTLRQPTLELTRLETLTIQGRQLKPIRLKPWQSAMTVVSWNPTRSDPRGPVPQFGVHVAALGDGQLTDDLGAGMTQIRLSQWTT